MQRSEQINELASALAKAQGNLHGASKNKENPGFKGSHYADLQSVRDACREPLAANGLSVVQGTRVVGNDILLVTLLLHASGQWIESVYPIRPIKNDPQGYGSAYTYARRYSLMAIVGIAPEDDDGNDATGRGQEQPERRDFGNRPRDRQPARGSRETREPNGHHAINEEFSRGDEPRPSWSTFVGNRLREAKVEWMKEMMAAEVPPRGRDQHAEISNEPRIVNHLVTRLIELGQIDPDAVTKDGRPGTRDPDKAREVLTDFYGRRPRSISKAVDKYIGEKLRDARVALKMPPSEEDREAAIEAAKSKEEPVPVGEAEGETWEPGRE